MMIYRLHIDRYGSVVGVFMSVFLIWISNYMGIKFEEYSAAGIKVGEVSQVDHVELAKSQNITDDTSCGLEEEGQELILEETEESNVEV